MNKIYKVMYSKVKQCCVVVSEIAKSHGRHTKRSVAKSSAALTAGVLIALGSFSFVGMPVAQAADGTESMKNNDYVGANGYYWYFDEKTNQWTKYPYKISSINNNRSWQELPNYEGGGAKEPGAVTAGLYAQAGEQTVTIGNRNAGQSKGSVFIGELDGYNDGGKNDPVGMKNNYVTAVGFQSNATGWGSIAIGSNAVAENTRETSQVVDYDGNKGTSGTVQDDNYGIKLNPPITWSSVALGYNAKAKDGNIAIGANSDATSTDKGDSYVSVGNGTLKRRITNVAKGTDNSDVVTVGQMNDAIKQADNLNVNAGWGINVADENDPTNTGKGTKNVISLKHNLGTGYNDDEAKGMIIGGLVEDRDTAKQYGAADANSVIVGAGKALASGKSSVVVGGLDNVASGATSVVIGGDNNNAAGNQSAVFGGRDNKAVGVASTASGGIMNAAVGQQATAIGGSNNYVLGANATAVGGLGRDYANGEVVYDSAIRGSSSVGIAGGSTGEKAMGALAAGHQSVVTTENGTAIGYQATTDEANTIAFGHDAGDVSGYTIKWKQLPPNQINADGTTNDYTQAPESVTENKYTTAAYNRLVKVADGQDDHDVVVMEQLNNAKNDLKVNAGWGINVNDVTTKNDGKETTTKNVISLNRNLGTNYGNPWKGEGKVTFEASGENSLILGGAASILQSNVDDNVKAGAYGKDSVLVGGFNNLIETNKIQTGEDAVIVGGDTNKVTGLRSVIIGGYQNNVSGGHSVVVGGELNETNGGGAGVFGGQSNKAAGEYSSVLGGDQNEADGDWSSAIGGTTNIASGRYATVLGGVSNDAKGNESVVVGGAQNVAIGEESTVNGGTQNTSYGISSYAAGGMNNMAFGNASVALGGIKSNVNAKVSTGIAGGSTEEKAITALAAGHQSVVTNSGVEWRKATQEDFDAIKQKLPSWSGFIYTEPEDPYTTYVLDKVSTAVGYQSTADAPGVIAFGHDKGDVASVAKKWKQKATEKDGKYYDANDKEISYEDYYKLANEDGTWNDYTQDPIGTENITYQSAYYNRLVKAADGIDAHDAVVMEQLKPYTKSDASNIGSNLKTYTVGDDGETITEADATEDQKKANKDAWGEALGSGTLTTAATAKDSNQLVTGNTLYNYDAPVAETGKKLNYVSANNTTGQNLLNLDRQVKTNTDTLSDVDSRSVKYDTKTENGKTVVDNTKITLAGDGGTTITHLKDGVNDSDAATVGQLNSKIAGVNYTAGNGIAMDSTAKTISAKAGNGITVDTNGINAKAGTGITVDANGINVNTGKHLSVNTNGQIDVGDNGTIAENDGNLVTGKTVYDALHGGLDNITVGKDGKDGKDGSIGIAGKDGKDGYTMTIIKTEQGAAGVDGKDGITRVVYQDKDGNGKHTFATLDDGLKFKGDDSTTIAKKLNEQLNITGGADSTKLTDKNIGVNSSTDGLKIQLAKNLAGITSIANQTTTGKGDAQTTTGAKIDLKDDGSISVNSGKITDVKSGLTATDGTYADTDKNNAANIGDVHSMIEKEAGNTDDKLALKANVAADNIGTHITDTTAQKTNLDNWGAAIGTGAVADITNEHANQLVTGKTVYDALHGGLDNITVGKDGQNGKDGSIGIAGQNGKDGYTMTIIKTEQGAAG
ncbi:ESPR-type extended signal peptide-containing protein, partial [uncultured Dialister sp.]|uniref:ESPR-type extended signal peptide-containing protein n=1 Tax=uncultured Dialister sp. TaxID=278064 RepID=UPI0025985B4E